VPAQIHIIIIRKVAAIQLATVSYACNAKPPITQFSLFFKIKPRKCSWS